MREQFFYFLKFLFQKKNQKQKLLKNKVTGDNKKAHNKPPLEEAKALGNKLSDKKAYNKPPLEEDLYSLDEYQLNNLLDKRVQFHFYSLDSLKETKLLVSGFNKAQYKTKKDILIELKGQDLSHPIVLVCKKGDSSKAFSQVLREKGFINCYYLKKGFL